MMLSPQSSSSLKTAIDTSAFCVCGNRFVDGRNVCFNCGGPRPMGAMLVAHGHNDGPPGLMGTVQRVAQRDKEWSSGEHQFTYEAILQKTEGARLGIDVLTAFDGRLFVDQIWNGGVADLWNRHTFGVSITKGDYIISVNGILDLRMMLEMLRTTHVLRITFLRTVAIPSCFRFTDGGSVEGPAGPLCVGSRGRAKGAASNGGGSMRKGGHRSMTAQHQSDGICTDRSDQVRFNVEVEKNSSEPLGLDMMLPGKNERGKVNGFVVQGITTDGLVDRWNQQSVSPYKVRPGDHIIEVNGIEDDSKMLHEFTSDTAEVKFIVHRMPDSKPLPAQSRKMQIVPRRRPHGSTTHRKIEEDASAAPAKTDDETMTRNVLGGDCVEREAQQAVDVKIAAERLRPHADECVPSAEESNCQGFAVAERLVQEEASAMVAALEQELDRTNPCVQGEVNGSAAALERELERVGQRAVTDRHALEGANARVAAAEKHVEHLQRELKIANQRVRQEADARAVAERHAQEAANAKAAAKHHAEHLQQTLVNANQQAVQLQWELDNVSLMENQRRIIRK